MKRDAVILVVAVLLLGLLGARSVHDWADCESRGGDYVRGVFWFECVDEDPLRGDR